jgi:hypothetical protein
VDHFGMAPDTKILETTTLGQLLERYQNEITPLGFPARGWRAMA